MGDNFGRNLCYALSRFVSDGKRYFHITINLLILFILWKLQLQKIKFCTEKLLFVCFLDDIQIIAVVNVNNNHVMCSFNLESQLCFNAVSYSRSSGW